MSRTRTKLTAGAAGSSPRSVEVLVTPPPPEPLLLEGDEFYVSHDGVSRTFYKLHSWAAGRNARTPMALEEFYDLQGARKTFILRKSEIFNRDNAVETNILAPNVQGIVSLGRPFGAFEIQEIDQGVFGSAGTGSTTWESSIAMSLFFSSNPQLLRGNVVELGSGVGLGGILSQAAAFQSDTGVKSFSLTDGNDEVLRQCRINLNRSRTANPQHKQIPMHVSKVDWYDYVGGTPDQAPVYDTVIASDCAYLYPDVVALSRALESLCSRETDSRIHLFGPCDRGAFHELVLQLRDKLKLTVAVDWIEMSRYRLKPLRSGMNHADVAHFRQYCHEQDECDFASKKGASFLHVTASHSTQTETLEDHEKSLSDID